ncbi:eukaryotic peptide chain release factor GTP-binding subunit-like [Thrips palmi]|uniref:Eukaryotic peptide chain release factor GTP-binding subunit-like n=1 Tax=Thrips palmi TaxID=161013 RepID=A0A6P9ABN3_THRPL|nr:eukaryotic peptide chain release factor GTP-binding subunit-like [Thrips palmi]
MALSGSVCVLAVLAVVLVGQTTAAPAPEPAPTPSPIWRLFGGLGGYSGGYSGGYNRGGFGGYGQRGSRAYNGPPPEGPNEYKAICRVNNADNYAFGPGHIPAGPVCPW